MMMTLEQAETRNFVERKQKRWNLVYYLRVFESRSGDLLGHLVDIHTDGMMLISERHIPLGEEFQLQMEIPGDTKGSNKLIKLHAHSIWSKPDLNPHYNDTGFRITQLSPDALSGITQVIEEYKIS